ASDRLWSESRCALPEKYWKRYRVEPSCAASWLLLTITLLTFSFFTKKVIHLLISIPNRSGHPWQSYKPMQGFFHPMDTHHIASLLQRTTICFTFIPQEV